MPGSQMNWTSTLLVQPVAMLPVNPDRPGVGASLALLGTPFRHRGAAVWNVVQEFAGVDDQ